MLAWRLVGGTRTGQIVADDGHGGGLAVNETASETGQAVFWLTGTNYGPGTRHDSQDEAKAVAQHWADTGERREPSV